MTKDTAAKLLRRIAEEIVQHPEELRVQVIDRGDELEMNAKAHRGDTGKLLGARGSIWRALQFIFATIGRQQKKKIVLNPMLEPTEGGYDKYPSFQPRERWDRDRICDLLTEVVHEIWPGAYVWNEDDMAVTKLQLCDATSSELADEVIRALTAITVNIGKRQGRTFEWELVEAQPATAAGRHTKEK